MSTDPTTQQLPDLRTELADAQSWATGLIGNVRPEQYALPTPCTEYDVSDLLRHLYGVLDRTIVTGSGRPAESVPGMAESVTEPPVDGFRERAEAAQAAWSDDAALARMVEVPWGTVPGAIVVGVYLAEVVAHGWDLALATGQDPEADPRSAAAAEAVMRRALPAEGRDQWPFDNPITPTANALPTARLANWLGRSA